MFVVDLLGEEIIGVKLKKGFLNRKKRLVFIKADGKLKGKKAVLIIPSDCVNKDEKISGLVSMLENLGFKVVGKLAEPLVLYRLLKSYINDESERLVINIGEKKSYIYKLNKLGPTHVLPQPINTSEIIPKVQELIGKEREIKKGFYFGVKSLTFDKDLFEKQTGISLTSAEGALKKYLQKGKVNFPIDEIGKLVPIVSAVLFFDKKEITEEKNFARLFLISVGTALIVAGLVVAGWRLIILPDKAIVGKPAPTIIKTAITQTPTPTPKVNPEEVKIRVLNGSGIPGLAGDISEVLKEKSFNVLEAGNAQSFNFATTKVYYKKGFKQKADLVVENLKDREIATVEAALDLKGEADVEIILGEK